MLIDNIYKNTTMAIPLQETARPKSIKRGVRQGHNSSKLFTLARLHSNEWRNMGININGKTLNLRYADDIVIIASTFAELQSMVIELAKKYDKNTYAKKT